MDASQSRHRKTRGHRTLSADAKPKDARTMALQVLSRARRLAAEGKHRLTTEILSDAIKKSHLPRREEALATELVYSTIRRGLTLDWIIEEFSGVEVARIQPELLIVLRLGVLQLVYLRSVPDYAAVNESVELARRTLGKKAAGFANSVLRKIARGASSLPFPARSESIIEHLSVVHSHPKWLVQRWVERLGEDAAESVCIANNAPPPTTARVNALKVTREQVIERLAAGGVEATPRDQEDMVEIIRCPGRITSLASFREGWFYLQDSSGIISTKMLAPSGGDKVLDVCSAPGGKATHIAELMQNRGLIIACDIEARKMPALRENIDRLGTSIVHPLVADGTKIDGILRPDFDRVLIDAPCSNTGVLRRRVEARWRLGERDLQILPGTQLDLLKSAAKTLKNRGMLVYSTCSIEREENQYVVATFLGEETAFELVEERAFLPTIGRDDGGYAAKLLRK